MTARDRATAARHPTRDRVLVLLAQRQSATSRMYGWVITKADDREQFVTINGNQDWHWTRTRRDAELFLTRAQAERWIGQRLNGRGRTMEIVA